MNILVKSHFFPNQIGIHGVDLDKINLDDEDDPDIFYIICSTCSRTRIINSVTTYITLINNSKLIKKHFIRAYINKCWSSLTGLIV